MTNDRRTFLNRVGLAGGALVVGPTTVSWTTTATASEDDARVSGTISYFGEPVEDAVASVGPNSDTTDEDGTYEIVIDAAELEGDEVGKIGSTVLEVSADGYADERRAVAVAPGGSITADVSLEREWGDDVGELQVYATEVGGGETIPCRVRVYGDDEYYADAPEGAIPDSSTWSRGFRVSEGWWEVRVSDAPGYDDGYAEVYVAAGTSELAWVELEEGDREIPETGRLRGIVTDEDGDPIENAGLRVGGKSFTTDGNGEFETDLEHGRHSVVAVADGYDVRRGTVTVRFGRTTELAVSLEST
ncbi:carboxypeptidase-like regulatory domain-containing protein [Natrarchaeobius oligotrophus]|uniref:Carboxypeptidase regulatory-like domain-containing protein n=1 Tax=Natrarchaeobius chitinivorans TaxID=1679083 RepID=A0A3N6MGD8_NATCH|nr:carboxypeptidase-like regulatory domain-containing protein [Natrarchaeobius chitinivorans]RQH00055.1 carboxypeptidase regulatory-like domain-containing protein [Natrarchaeobius chitinivorans]